MPSLSDSAPDNWLKLDLAICDNALARGRLQHQVVNCSQRTLDSVLELWCLSFGACWQLS